MSLWAVLRDQNDVIQCIYISLFVYSSEHKGVLAAYKYINDTDYSTFSWLCLEARTPLPAHLANYVPINGNKTAEIKKPAAYVPQHEEAQNFWKEIYQWLIFYEEQ